MATPYFTRAMFAFLKDLEDNNDREWFNRNKDRYEDLIRDSAIRFITAAHIDRTVDVGGGDGDQPGSVLHLPHPHQYRHRHLRGGSPRSLQESPVRGAEFERHGTTLVGRT